jgi:hypothetical protein
MKTVFIESRSGYICYEKQVRKICEDDYQAVHGLSFDDFGRAWDTLGMGFQIMNVSRAVCYHIFVAVIL